MATIEDTIVQPGDTVVLDPERPQRAPHRRRPFVLAALAAAVVVAVASFAAAQWRTADANGESARLWRDRSESAEARLKLAVRAVEGARAELVTAQARLTTAEASVERLEGRQRELANEKATAEDARLSLEQQAERLAQEREDLIGVANAFISCSEQMQDVVLAIGGGGDVGDYGDAQDACDDAQSALADYNAAHGG